VFWLISQLSINDLNTGDIVLFAENKILLKDHYPSIKDFIWHFLEEVGWVFAIYFYGKYFYHMGMVVDKADIPPEIQLPKEYCHEQKFILEARIHQGVQLHSLTQRITDRPEKISIRKITPKLNAYQRAGVKIALRCFYGRPFEKNWLEFIGAWVDSPWIPELKSNLSSLTCPEVIAQTLKIAGALEDSLPSNEFIPDNFSQHYKEPIHFHSPFSFSSEILIKNGSQLLITLS